MLIVLKMETGLQTKEGGPPLEAGIGKKKWISLDWQSGM